MTNSQNSFNSDDFREEYFQQKRIALFRIQALLSLVDNDSDGMEFTEHETPKLDRLEALNTILEHSIEDFENN